MHRVPVIVSPRPAILWTQQQLMRCVMPDKVVLKGFHMDKYAPGDWSKTGWLTTHNQPIYYNNHSNPTYAVEYQQNPSSHYPPELKIPKDADVIDGTRMGNSKPTGWLLHNQPIYHDGTTYAVITSRSPHGGRRTTRTRNVRTKTTKKTKKNNRRSSRRSSRR